MPHTTGCFWTLHTVSPKYNLLIDIDIDADVDRKLCLNNRRQVLELWEKIFWFIFKMVLQKHQLTHSYILNGGQDVGCRVDWLKGDLYHHCHQLNLCLGSKMCNIALKTNQNRQIWIYLSPMCIGYCIYQASSSFNSLHHTYKYHQS